MRLNKNKRKLFIILVVVFASLGFVFSVQAVMNQKPSVFQIQMKVDFGPAGKPLYAETITIERGTTPKEAVSQAFPLLSGVACCSFRDVIEIGGVRINPAKNMWWTCTVNGSKKISPQNKKLNPGDVVEWKYIQDSQ